MGVVTPAGFVVAVRGKTLGYYKSEARARKRCDAERAAGVDARVYEVVFSSALGDA